MIATCSASQQHSPFTARKLPVEANGVFTGFSPHVTSLTDYYPFGSGMEGRTVDKGYRYGFGSHEILTKFDETYNTVDMGDRWLSLRIGRTFKTDSKGYVFEGVSPYSYASCNPILFIDPDGKVVIAINQEAQRNILNTLSPDDRKYVRFKKDGTLDSKRLARAGSSSENYRALLTQVESEIVYRYIVSATYPDMNNEGRPTRLVGDREIGTRGVTLLPGAEIDPSPDNDVWIYTSKNLSEKKQATVTAHEGYGHAYFFELQKQGEDVNPNHLFEAELIELDPNAEDPFERYGINQVETNIPLKNQIEAREKEAEMNFQKGKDE